MTIDGTHLIAQQALVAFECANHALAPRCDHCGCTVTGHGVEPVAGPRNAQPGSTAGSAVERARRGRSVLRERVAEEEAGDDYCLTLERRGGSAVVGAHSPRHAEDSAELMRWGGASRVGVYTWPGRRERDDDDSGKTPTRSRQS